MGTSLTQRKVCFTFIQTHKNELNYKKYELVIRVERTSRSKRMNNSELHCKGEARSIKKKENKNERTNEIPYLISL
jgi:hypothetical protein